MRGITKHFGDLTANSGVDLDLYKGEVHGLLGENGAGKTTLMNMLFGLFSPDSGELTVRGKTVEFSSPRDALDLGIGMVHQHFMLLPEFTVAENVVLGTRGSGNMRLRQADIESDVLKTVQKYDLAIDVSQPISELTVDAQQLVELLKLLHRGADVLILDEPTAVLGPAEIDRLFETLKGLCDRGHSVVIITHKLGEVTRIADRVTVLRAGKLMETARRGELDEHNLAIAMIGRELPEAPERPDHVSASSVAPVLMVDGLTVPNDRNALAVDRISFNAVPGEILGIVGVEGNGQTELIQALSGLRDPLEGSIWVSGISSESALCGQAGPGPPHRGNHPVRPDGSTLSTCPSPS